jgi:hypothetical protein
MSDWLWGAALLPVIVCGAMCVGGIVAAVVGLSRAGRHHDRYDQRERRSSDRQPQ